MVFRFFCLFNEFTLALTVWWLFLFAPTSGEGPAEKAFDSFPTFPLLLLHLTFPPEPPPPTFTPTLTLVLHFLFLTFPSTSYLPETSGEGPAEKAFDSFTTFPLLLLHLTFPPLLHISYILHSTLLLFCYILHFLLFVLSYMLYFLLNLLLLHFSYILHSPYFSWTSSSFSVSYISFYFLFTPMATERLRFLNRPSLLLNPANE